MPDAESGLVLSRVTSQGTQLLASSDGRISLEDGKSHMIEWKRDQAGKGLAALPLSSLSATTTPKCVARSRDDSAAE